MNRRVPRDGQPVRISEQPVRTLLRGTPDASAEAREPKTPALYLEIRPFTRDAGQGMRLEIDIGTPVKS